jgi:RNA polymerase sigma-70 factor, ECF subfamily
MNMPHVFPLSADSEDIRLLQGVARHDRGAFEALYHAYHRRLARFLLRLAPRYEFAEEVINDTFWVVWQKAAEFRGASRVSTWIMGIAYRRALRGLRDERRIGRMRDDEYDDAVHGQAEVSDPVDVRDWIAQGLQALPAEQRLALELAYFMGHSCEEIATIMECPVGTVKARMHHAREKMRILLPALGGSSPDVQP